MKTDPMLLHNSYINYDHCGYAKSKIKSPRPSQTKIQKCDIGAQGYLEKLPYMLKASQWRYKLCT